MRLLRFHRALMPLRPVNLDCVNVQIPDKIDRSRKLLRIVNK